jgi:PAS domain S-box-containing protein
MKIRNKISLSFITIFIITLVFVGVAFDLYTSHVIKKDIYSYLSSSNRARAEHIRTFIQGKEISSVILASASIYRDLLSEPTNSSQYKIIKEKIDKRLERTLLSDPAIHQVLILDKKGLVVASSDKVEDGVDKSQDDIFLKAQIGTNFKSVYYSEVIGNFAYAVSSPIFDDVGSLLGVSVLRYSADDFYAIASSENGLGDTEENFLINNDRFFITPSRFFGETVILKQKVETPNAGNCFDPKEIEYVKKNGYSGIEKIETHSHVLQALDYRNTNITGTHSYIPETGWCLITKADTSDIMSYRYGLILFIFLAFLASGLILSFVGSLLSRKITNPLETLTQFTKKIKKGDFNFKAEVKTKDEVGDLSHSFNLMAEAVKNSNSSIEQKVEEQTGELKTKTEQLELQKSAMLNVMEDIQAEKDRSLGLAKDLEKFKLAVDNASDHVIITDPDGVILYANKAVERITGYKREEVIGKKSGSKQTWGGFMDTAFYQTMWETIKVKKQNFIGELHNRRKNGEDYEVLASISPVLDDRGEVQFFVGIERDITKEKEVDKAKTEFVSLASHQLRTPLAAINWYTEMLLNGDAGAINEEQKKYLREVDAGNRRMIDLVNSLLNVSRLDLGTFMIEPEPIDILAVSKSVLDELRPQIETKKLKIEENYNSDVPNPYPADAKLLRIVFQNLLSNAVKYTPANGSVTVNILPVIKGKTFGGQEMAGDNLALSVADTGMGIPAGQHDKIFSKLFRADNARESESEGTGLGLYMVKSIVEQSGGDAWFESIENKGATFYVILPLIGMKKKVGEKKLG